MPRLMQRSSRRFHKNSKPSSPRCRAIMGGVCADTDGRGEPLQALLSSDLQPPLEDGQANSFSLRFTGLSVLVLSNRWVSPDMRFTETLQFLAGVFTQLQSASA